MNTPKLPPLPKNLPNVVRRIRACEGDVAAQVVFEHALNKYALAAIEAQGVLDAMRTALQRIADWKSHDLQLAVGRGSNGVRDFYRQIAIDALASAPPAPQAAVVQQEPHHWVVPDYGLLFPSEESAKRYLDNIGSDAQPIACYTRHAQQAKQQPLSDKEADRMTERFYLNGRPVPALYRLSLVRATERHYGIKE